MTVLLSMNAFDRTITYKGSTKLINDDYWETEISPILVPMWDSPKDKLELFVYRDDGYHLIQRYKYSRNFKTKKSGWSSYEFDPSALDESIVTDLYDSIVEKFVNYKEVGEAEYERQLLLKFKEQGKLSWDKLKLVRKFLLTESDWTQVEDAPITPELKELWKKYRTYLRELFTQNTAASSPYDVKFPITPVEYENRKSVDVLPLVKDAFGDQGTETEYLFSESHFWMLTSNAVNSFSKKMAVYMSMNAIIDDATHAVPGARYLRPFRNDTELGAGSLEREEDRRQLKLAGRDPDEYLSALLTRIENGEI